MHTSGSAPSLLCVVLVYLTMLFNPKSVLENNSLHADSYTF